MRLFSSARHPAKPITSATTANASPKPSKSEKLKTKADSAPAIMASSAALRMLMQLLPDSAKTVETASHELTQRFKLLADSAGSQSSIMQALIESISAIPLADRKVTLEEFIQLFGTTLDDAMAKMIFVTEKAISMVASMDGAIKNLKEIEAFSEQVQEIAGFSNMLALNALIEAARAGDVGKGFGVVAVEMKSFSTKIGTLSENMRARTEIIMQSLTSGFAILEEVSATDISANIAGKKTLETLMQGLVRQNDESMRVMQESSATSQQIANAIQGLIVNLQFQDRNSQIAENAVNIIGYCLEVFNTAWKKESLLAQSGARAGDMPGMQQAAEKLVSVVKLSEIRHRYLQLLSAEGVLSAPAGAAHMAAPAADDIELF